MYSYSYSSQIVDNFQKSRGRGCHHIKELWPVLNYETVVLMFRKDQVRWNIYKKLAKLADRLLAAGLRTDVVNLNLLTGVKYFRKIAEKELEEYQIRRDIS